ncbi:MAG: thioredoxin family protein [Acidimicrobiales bacterium]
MVPRLAVVVGLLTLFAVARALYGRRQVRLQRGPESHPAVPASLRAGAARTWVVFTTPWCAACGPVEEQLRTSDPEARVVRVDATQEPALAGAFSVQSAPTALLADGEGRVQARLVGVEAVDRYLLAAGRDA